jgi:uncharacterized protein YpmB
MNKRTFELPSVMKWIIGIFFVLCMVVLVFLIILYNQIQDSKVQGNQEAEQRVIQESTIDQIIKTTRFFGETGYHIIYGKTNDNVVQIAFLPDKPESNIVVINEEDIVSSDEVQQAWQQDCSSCQLIKIVPAMLKGDPLWEISYEDEANRYVLEYVSMYDGSQYEEFRFKKMFE